MAWRFWLIGGLALLPLGAQAGLDDAGQQRRLAGLLQEADAQYQRELADCRQRFALNACVDEARARHRQATSDLKIQRRVLDERQRQQRAAERQDVVERRQQILGARLPKSDGSPASAPQSASAAARPARQAKRVKDEAAATAKAAERAAAARKLQATIQADQARIKARQAQREARGKQVQPLPLPASSPP